ncbi:MAG: TonB-dependent receptor [Parabacteroides sp.]|nr:TonB-dependent receptor [Parabacteroides sp.]
MQKNCITPLLWAEKSPHATFKKTPIIMKSLFFACLIGSAGLVQATNTYAQTTTVSLHVENQTVGDVLQQIESKTDFSFFFNNRHVDLNRQVSISMNETNIFKILDAVFDGTDVVYQVVDNRIVLSKRNETLPLVQQSGKKITGTVLDATGMPVIGANVMVKGTTNGTITDMDGKFSLDVEEGAILVVSYIGFSNQEIKVGNQTSLSVTLKEDSKALDEVVVVAFGTQKKSNLTASVATVDAEALANRPVANVSQALQGVSPGLNIMAANEGGALNSNPSINIRGTGTIGEGSSSAPLVLIDGVEGDMNLINTQDIENISVLKDAGASAIYGSRAAFGVILITTKKGKEGRTTVNYNNNFRWATPTKLPSFLDSYSFNTYFNEAAANAGLGAQYTPEVMEKTKLFMEGKIPYGTEYDANGIWKKNMESFGNTEWFGVYYKDWSFSQEHNLSVSGGTDKANYYISTNFQDLGSDQNYGNEDYKRYTFNSKINTKPFKWLDVNANIKFSRKDYQAPSYQMNQVYYHSMPRRRPSNPLYTPDGQFNKESQLNEIDHGGMYNEDLDIFYQQVQLVFTPLKDWKIFAEGNFRIDRSEKHTDVQVILERKEDGSYFPMDRDDGLGGRSYVREETGRTNYINPNIYTQYNKSFKSGHNLAVMAGFQAELNRYKSIFAQRDGIISPEVPSLGNTTSTTAYSMGSTIYEWATVGFFGRVNYDYQGKYLAEVNYRYDGSSRFNREQRWNSFPSFSLAWNLARESFMEDSQDFLNMLKIRASYGNLGNQATNEIYPFYTAMDLKQGGGSWLINGQQPNIANPAKPISPFLTWETVTSYNLGLDFGLFNNRLSGTFEYYWRYTNDMVAPGEEIPNTAGVASPYTNNAQMRTNGWDLNIGWRDVLDSGLSYGVNFVLSDNQSKILKYPNATKTIFNSDGTNRYYEGAMLGDIWGYEVIDLARNEEQMKEHLASLPNGGQDALGSNWAAGDVMYADLNNDGKIDGGKGVVGDSGDRKIIGNNTPRYNFGLTLNAAYKGFDISLFFQGTMKRDMWLTGLYFWGADNGYWQSTALKETMDYFRPADTDSYFGPNVDGYLPRPLLQGDQKNKQTSTMYLQNAAYMRLKNLQIGYTFPKEFMNRINISNLRVFLSADNIFTISGLKADAYDPEVLNGYGAGSGKAAPLKTTISCGLSVTL